MRQRWRTVLVACLGLGLAACGGLPPTNPDTAFQTQVDGGIRRSVDRTPGIGMGRRISRDRVGLRHRRDRIRHRGDRHRIRRHPRFPRYSRLRYPYLYPTTYLYPSYLYQPYTYPVTYPATYPLIDTVTESDDDNPDVVVVVNPDED